MTTTDNDTPALSNSNKLTVSVATSANRAPTLNAISNMTVNEGATANQVITGSDPDGDALTFTKAAGPTFMAVTTTNGTSGNVHLAPGFSDAGTSSASVQASDGRGGTDTKSLKRKGDVVDKRAKLNE